MKTRMTIIAITLAAASAALGQSGNTTLGTNAGASITTGTDNTLLGENAGQSLTRGNNSVFIGKDAGRLLDLESDNICIGWLAGSGGASGIDNVFIGAEAGLFNTGSDNVFIGTQAGQNNTSGRDNTFVGEEAGESNTTGFANTFVGEDAGFNNTTGNDNTAVGRTALKQCTTGFGNTAVGNEAGFDIEIGIRNTSMGDLAGIDIGEGHFNTMLGSRAGEHTEYGDYNTCVGTLAGFDNNRTNGTMNANRNTYLGVAAGHANREGSDNVALGAFADFGRWTSSEQQLFDGFSGIWGQRPDGAPGTVNASRTVMVGASAVVGHDDAIGIGYGATSNGLGAIAIGSGASSTHVDATTIGFGAVSHADNTAVIGNNTTVGWHPGADAITELGSPLYRFTNVTAQGYDVLASATQPATIDLWADDGAGNDDKWRIQAADGGNVTIESFASGVYEAKLTVHNNGNVTIPGEISINSDARLKRDVAPIDGARELIMRLDGKTYRWNDADDRDDNVHYGLIAQEVEDVLPELVSESATGIKSVNYQGLVPVLINAVKEQENTIQSQEGQIHALRDANATLAERLAKLEAMVQRMAAK